MTRNAAFLLLIVTLMVATVLGGPQQSWASEPTQSPDPLGGSISASPTGTPPATDPSTDGGTGGSYYNDPARQNGGIKQENDPPPARERVVYRDRVRQVPAPHPTTVNGHHAGQGHGALWNPLLKGSGAASKSYVDAHDQQLREELAQAQGSGAPKKNEREMRIMEIPIEFSIAPAAEAAKAAASAATTPTWAWILIGVFAALIIGVLVWLIATRRNPIATLVRSLNADANRQLAKATITGDFASLVFVPTKEELQLGEKALAVKGRSRVSTPCCMTVEHFDDSAAVTPPTTATAPAPPAEGGQKIDFHPTITVGYPAARGGDRDYDRPAVATIPPPRKGNGTLRQALPPTGGDELREELEGLRTDLGNAERRRLAAERRAEKAEQRVETRRPVTIPPRPIATPPHAAAAPQQPPAAEAAPALCEQCGVNPREPHPRGGYHRRCRACFLAERQQGTPSGKATGGEGMSPQVESFFKAAMQRFAAEKKPAASAAPAPKGEVVSPGGVILPK